MDTMLELLKIDLGITHNKRDTYFTALIKAAKAELERKGCEIDEAAVDDQMLVVDYAAWQYRKRIDGGSVPNNIILRIRNRKLRKLSASGGDVVE